MPRDEYKIVQAGIGRPELGDVRQLTIRPADGGGFECTAIVAYRDTDASPVVVNESESFSAQWAQASFPVVADVRTKMVQAFELRFQAVLPPA